MKPNKFATRLLVNAEKDAIYLWHLRMANFSRSFPSWERATVLSSEELPGRQVRTVMVFEKKWRKQKAVFRIHYPRGNQIIRIKQEVGSVKSFDVYIEIKSLGENLYELLERVEYTLAWPWFFARFRKKRLEERCKRFFNYKNELMMKDLELLKRPVKPLKILVSGSKGLIGSSLVDFLESLGHEVWRLVRKKEDQQKVTDVLYNTETGEVNRSALEGFDAVVHLWGRSIQDRWTKKIKKEVLLSRYETTKQLAKVLASLQRSPKAFLCASAIGYYGDRGSAWVDEHNTKGEHSFLAEVCKVWENASEFLKVHGIRVAHLRFGIVLSSKKGALYEIVKLFRWGVGGMLGSGDQYMSWIAIDDVVGAIYHVILHSDLEGAVNVTSPHPVSNREFSKKISYYLKRPLGPSVPSFILKLFKGEMAEELLLSSVKVSPKKLLDTGYEFRYPYLEEALPHLI